MKRLQEIQTWIEQAEPEMKKMRDYLFENPELAFGEWKACAYVKALLASKGIEITMPYGGMETAFHTHFKVGSPSCHIAILAEYDALPEIGHACGHNLICTASVYTYLLVKEMCERYQIDAEVSLIGTPAEESGSGKVQLMKAGVFEGIDAAYIMHPTSGVTRIAGRCLACESLMIRYHGQSAHASSRPHEGINALDAVNLFFHAIGCLRQQVTPDVRMQGIITQGGSVPNSIPDATEISYILRSLDNQTMRTLEAKVKNCAAAGALATGCSFEFLVDDACKAREFNTVLGDVCRNYVRELGEPCQDGFPDDSGSTDFGDVSAVMPTVNLYTSIHDVRISSHTERFAACTISEKSMHALRVSVGAMAASILDLCEQPKRIHAAKAEFQQTHSH